MIVVVNESYGHGDSGKFSPEKIFASGEAAVHFPYHVLQGIQ